MEIHSVARCRSLLGTLGVVFGGLTNDWYAELAPRSGTCFKLLGIHNLMEGVPIDPNFRGEPTALLINRGDTHFEITRESKLAQFKFYCTCCHGNGFLRPVLEEVSSIEELGQTNRGQSFNGSSNEKLYQPEFNLPVLSQLIGPN